MMTTATATATAPKDGPVRFGEPLLPRSMRPIEPNQMVDASFVCGERKHLTLLGDDTIEAGEQDITYWKKVGVDLAMNQELIIRNQARTMRRVMIVEQVIGNRSTGL